MKKLLMLLLIFICSFSLFSCKDEKTTGEEYKIYELALKSGYTGTYEEWLESIKGAPGRDGREIELDIKDNYIVWRYKGDSNWIQLKNVNDLIGPKGEDGKSAYELYLETHPDYTGTEAEWLDDLLNDRLINGSYRLNRELVPIKNAGKYIQKTFMGVYFYKDGNVPYVGLNELISIFSRAFTKNINHTIDKENKTYTFSYSYNAKDYTMSIDWANDKITASSMDFFTYLLNQIAEPTHEYIKDANRKATGDKEFTLDLKAAHIDAIFFNDDILLQVDVASAIMLSYRLLNLAFNGDYYYFFKGYGSTTNGEEMRKSSKNSNSMPADLRKATNNGLLFILDNYYGLKDYKDIDSFDDVLFYQEEIQMYLNNSNPYLHNIGYDLLLHGYLDDLHTNAVTNSVYHKYEDNDFKINFEELGSHITDYLANIKKYKAASIALPKLEEGEKPLRYEGNTAFIKLNSFYDNGLTYTHEGSKLRDDAWKYSSFYLVKQSLDDIREYNKTHNSAIKNVVLDLSENGGGELKVMNGILGLLTNEDIINPKTNIHTSADILEAYKVDANLDGNYTDDDAYTEFNYTLLISDISFSAGNYMPSIFKDMKLGKVIGINSYGGMCIVGSKVLLDGTIIKLSSETMLRSKTLDSDGKFTEIESGVEPDYPIPFAKFYDLKYLDSFINNGYQEV